MERRFSNPGMRRKKVCQFCADKAEAIDYKDVEKLRKYITERGKILPKRVTSTYFISYGVEEALASGNTVRRPRCSAETRCSTAIKEALSHPAPTSAPEEASLFRLSHMRLLNFKENY